jgi:hypothetical protein
MSTVSYIKLKQLLSVLYTEMENRVARFYELHNNRWFHIMNLSLEIIKTEDKHQRYMLAKYGHGFFNLKEY